MRLHSVIASLGVRRRRSGGGGGLGTVCCLLTGVALAGCGPVAPIDTDVQHVGANVFYGVPSPSPQPSLPPIVHFLNPVQRFPAPVEPAPVLPQPVVQTPAPTATATPLPDACPPLSPLVFPATNAGPLALRPPAPATYTYRRTARITTNPGTATAKTTQLPPAGTRQVTNVSAVGSAQDFMYDLVDTYNGIVTTTTYHLYPQGMAGTLPSTNGVAPGVYITSVVMTDAADPSQDSYFSPVAPGVEVFTFPAAPAATWSSAGTDPLTETTEVAGPTSSTPNGMNTIVDHTRVNACGVPIDAWEATLQGEFERAREGPNGTSTFTLTIDLATQYGGLIVADHLDLQYNDQKTSVATEYAISSTINVLPALPPS